MAQPAGAVVPPSASASALHPPTTTSAPDPLTSSNPPPRLSDTACASQAPPSASALAPPPPKMAHLPAPQTAFALLLHAARPRAGAGDGSGAGNHGDVSGGNRGKVGGGSGAGEDDDDYKEPEFGPLLGFDMEAAKDAGILEVLLLRYFDLQAAPWPLGAMIHSFSMLRNRTLADPLFLFKVCTERCRRGETVFGRNLNCMPLTFSLVSQLILHLWGSWLHM